MGIERPPVETWLLSLRPGERRHIRASEPSQPWLRAQPRALGCAAPTPTPASSAAPTPTPALQCRTCRAACVAMHSRQKECVQPSLMAPPSEPQTSMHTAQSCLLPPTVRGHHGLCCIFAFFLRRCGVPVP